MGRIGSEQIRTAIRQLSDLPWQPSVTTPESGVSADDSRHERGVPARLNIRSLLGHAVAFCAYAPH